MKDRFNKAKEKAIVGAVVGGTAGFFLPVISTIGGAIIGGVIGFAAGGSSNKP